jgi:diphthamide biosynthesis protein 2
MTSAPTQAPVLSTPETHLFEDPTPVTETSSARYTKEELWDVYEITRTVREVRDAGWRRVALQFPDHMLRDAPRVVEALEGEIANPPALAANHGAPAIETSFNDLAIASTEKQPQIETRVVEGGERIRFYILADTSYGSCCVDEIAAEHADADVVVHYGRSCLSPTARLPVIYVFTSQPLDISSVIQTFKVTFPSANENVVLMSDITYNTHIPGIKAALLEEGYTNIITPEIVHEPSSVIPNRHVDDNTKAKLGEYSLFHISDPPSALLLTLTSRVKNMFIYPTTPSPPKAEPAAISPSMQASRLLRRRYALLTSLSTCPIFGILINTLSVKNYLSTVSTLQRLISSAGKKSYTFVVGKVNPAKIANFSEVGGWVVVGCWESSLVESGDFYRPLITPFELSLALQADGERIWDGSWVGDFSAIENLAHKTPSRAEPAVEDARQDQDEQNPAQDEDSEPESAPPEFDLRTGRYVSHSRPLAAAAASSRPSGEPPTDHATPSAASVDNKLIKRAKGDVATINGTLSPGAEYLRTQRTWTGLGSDFVDAGAEASMDIEEGRSGVARGYVVGNESERR